MDMDRFISSLARRFSRCYGLDYDDLTQEAEITMLEAANAYQAKNGASFETYARACVRHRFMSLAHHEKIYRWRVAVYAGLVRARRAPQEPATMPDDLLAQAEKALPERKRPLWEQYKALAGERGALTRLAKMHGKTREWARQQMNGIFALLRDRLEKRGEVPPARPAGDRRK